MQKCKQCLRLLPKQNFRVVKSRSTGARKSRGDSLRSVCKQCENMNVQAHQLLKMPVSEARKLWSLFVTMEPRNA